jgi:hypothetical protein
MKIPGALTYNASDQLLSHTAVRATDRLIPSEADICSATQTPRMFWNLKVHYRGYKSPLLDPILSQMNPRSYAVFRLFPSGLRTRTLYEIPSLRATHCAHLILLDLMTLIIFVKEYILYSLSCDLPQPVMSKCSDHHTSQYPQPVSFPQCQRPRFTIIQNYR